jgi:WD40 repeat protein
MARVGLQGMGGIGKSVLAAALAREEEMRRTFPDGMLWVSVGQNPSLTTLQLQLVRDLGEQAPVFETPQAGRALLRELLADRACLLILDDIWQPEAVTAFNALGPLGCLLFTTRDGSLITALGAVEQRLDVLPDDQALALLAQWSGRSVEDLPAVARAVARECGNLPLALAVCGAMARDGIAWEDLVSALREADLSFLDRSWPHYAYQDILRSLKVGVEALSRADPEAAGRYQELAVFPADAAVPEAAVLTLWQQSAALKDREARKLLSTLERKALVRLDGQAPNRRVSLHDLQHSFLRATQSDQAALHRLLVEAYRRLCPDGWSGGPNDGYFFQHLAHHLAGAGYGAELRALLLDCAWIQTKLRIAGVTSLVADYDLLQDDQDVSLVQGALRLSAHVLAEDPEQLASQLLGRLLAQPSNTLQELLRRAADHPVGPWLRPLTQSLTPPGGPLLRTLQGHEDEITALGVTPDGRTLVSGAADGTLKIWDLTTGAERCTLRRRGLTGRLSTAASDVGPPQRFYLAGHGVDVTAVVLTPDGQSAVAAFEDGTLFHFDLTLGAEQRMLRGPGGRVNTLALDPKGTWLAAGSADGSLRVWDLGGGTVRHTFSGSGAQVTSVVITRDGRSVLWGASDGTVRIGDLATGAEGRPLTRQRDSISAIAVTPNGQDLVFSTDNGALRVWDLMTGKHQRTLGLREEIEALAVTPDGRLLVSASYDHTLTARDLATGTVRCALEGHGGPVRAVTVTPDSRFIISGSADTTLKVWTLPPGPGGSDAGKKGPINAVAVLPDGRSAISASADGALKQWNLANGQELRTLMRDPEIVALAVTPDGRFAILGSALQTLIVWDLVAMAPRMVWRNRQSENLNERQEDDPQSTTSSQNPYGSISIEPPFFMCEHGAMMSSVAVTPGGGTALCGFASGVVMIWDLVGGDEPRTLWVHDTAVKALTVTPDGQAVISGAADRALKVWDLVTGAERFRLSGHSGSWIHAVTTTPDGRLVVSASDDRTVRVWDLTTRSEQGVFRGHTKRVHGVGVTPDGRLAVSASEDGTLMVWDLDCRRILARFVGDGGFLTCAAAPDGRTIVAGDKLGRVHFLRLQLQKKDSE